jgi:photosystem II stability/assembly factor-like uncharacterized protein
LPSESIEVEQEFELQGPDVWTDIHFIDDRRGVAVGGDEWFSGYRAYTVDGGHQWALRQMGDKELQSIAANEEQWIAVGIDGHLYYGASARLGDTATFVRQRFWEYLRGLTILRNGSGAIAVGGTGLNQGFVQQIRLDDWSSPSFDSVDVVLEAVAESSEGLTIAVGFGKMLLSEDGGITWREEIFRGAHLTDILFLPKGEGIICSRNGRVWKRNAAASEWKALSLPSFGRSYNFNRMSSHGEEIWICGDRGTLVFSKDVGEQWRRVPMDQDEDFLGISLTSTHVWITTRSGKILSLRR